MNRATQIPHPPSAYDAPADWGEAQGPSHPHTARSYPVRGANDKPGERGHSERTPSRREQRSWLKRFARGDALLEQFRRIYLSLQPLDGRDLPSAIGITSAVSGEGRTTVATGVAVAMAADLDVPVVLVEVDLTHPGVHRMLGGASEPGISEYLRGECNLAAAMRQMSDRLFVLPAGNPRGEAARLIRQLTAADLRTRLDSSGAVLVFDLPPVVDSSYGVQATALAESLVFVVRSGQTTIPKVREALSRLDERMVRSLVLNGPQPLLPRWLRGR
jgi:Mrp family chromosome partitioning ATPase